MITNEQIFILSLIIIIVLYYWNEGGKETEKSQVCAAFLTRTGAFLIDVVVNLGLLFIFMTLYYEIIPYFYSFDYAVTLIRESFLNNVSIFMLISGLYYAIMESSNMQGTIGKKP